MFSGKTPMIHLNFLTATLLLVIASGCSKDASNKKTSLAQLRNSVEELVKAEKYDSAIARLEEITTRFAENPNILHYKTLLAELYFKAGHYGSAQALYEHINQFYPSSENAEFSKYRSTQAMFYQSLRPECDQAETEKTLELCNDYLNNNYKKYHKEIAEIASTCTQRLLDKEIYIFDFYVKNSKYAAAEKRLHRIKEKFADQKYQDQIAYLDAKLASKTKNFDLVQDRIDYLKRTHPSSEYTQLAGELHTGPKQIFDF